MRRTIERFGNHDEPVPGDYFVVGTENDSWCVSREMAQFVEARLDESRPPRWIAFVDLTGARIRVLARLIESVCQCTAEQRGLARAFYRARRREAKSDKDWDEDE